MKHYFDRVQFTSGIAAAGATITVYVAGTGQTVLASIFSDDGVTAKANPFTADSNGNLDFYVADGRFDLKYVFGSSLLLQTDSEISDVTQSATGDANWIATSGTFGRFQNDCRVDGVHYTSIAAAYNDVPTCKSVTVPSGYTETLTANLNLNRSAVPIKFEGSAVITMGTFQVLMPGTTVSASFYAPNCFMSSGGASCVDFNYTGTAQAFVIGDAVNHSKDFLMRGITVNISGAGASALRLNNLDEFEVAACKFTGVTGASQVAIITNGTGTFVGVGKFDNVQVVMRGSNSIGYQFQTLTTHTQIIGGSLDLDAGASAVCFDVQGPNTQSIELMMPNANTCNTAVKVEASATSTGAIVGDLRIDSGVVTVVNYAAGTVANFLRCVDCATNAAYTDNGTNNSVEFPVLTQVNSLRWLVGSSSASNGFYQITDRSDNVPMIDKQSGAATVVNSSAGNPLRLNSQSNSATGVEFWGGGAAVATMSNTGVLKSTGVVSTGTAAGLTGTGACATITTQTGGAFAGRATCTGTTGVSTFIITPGSTAPNGWTCSAYDQTTRANLLQQTSTSQTACTLTATSITQNDVIVFTAIGF